MAAQRSSSALAMAFAASTTRPPPSDAIGLPSTPPRTAAAMSGTGPVGTCSTTDAPSTTAGASPAARSVVSRA